MAMTLRAPGGATVALLACVNVFAACSHGDDRAHAAAELDGSPPHRAAAGPLRDDWTTFAHDQQRSGFQAQRIGITKSNVGSLRLRWRYETGKSIQASPLVVDGRVYEATSDGEIFVLDGRTGALLWKRDLAGAKIAMTPALADGMLFVGDHREHGDFMALDARDGHTIWRAPFAGGIRSEPVIARGVVYEGETDGDAPACNHSGVHALDERTGKTLWTWYVDEHDREGGSVWSPLTYHDGRIIFGTGNTCEKGIATSNAIVRLDTSGTPLWSYSTARSIADSDVGGGTLLLHGQAIVTSKNGILYDVEEKTGALNWSTPLAHVAGYGGIGTPSTDGKMIVASAGYLNDPTKTQPAGGALYGLDTSGNVVWTIATQNPVSGNAPIVNGVAFTALDTAFTAIDVATGAKLWQYPMGHLAYPSPALVPSGIYFANTSGQVYAFELPHRHA